MDVVCALACALVLARSGARRAARSVRLRPASVAVLLGALAPGLAPADPLSIELTAVVEGTNPGTTGPPIPVEIGEPVTVSIEYEADAAPSVEDPLFSQFSGALLALEVHFQSSDLLFAFGPGGIPPGSISLQDDIGAVGVFLEDNLTVQTSDPTDTPLIEGLTVVAGTFSITDSINVVQGGGVPDLLVRQDLLPQGPIDVETTGTLIPLFTVGLLGQSPSPPIRLGQVQVVPEPGGALAGLGALMALALAVRRRGREAAGAGR